MTNPFLGVINSCLPEPHSGLLSGILFGIKAGLPPELYNSFIATGVVHIVVLSGQNISILVNIISKLTLPLGRKKSILITTAGIFLFVWFVGGGATIVRAAIMGSMSLIAVYFGRQNWSLLSLILAALIMLLIDPAIITDISFELSFLATLGIILVGSSRQIKNEIEIIREMKINLRTTLAAQMFTLPVIMVNFRQISVIAPLTNILIAPLITPIMILGFLMVLGGMIYLPAGQVVGWAEWLLLHVVIEIVKFTAKIPGASFNF